jgi:hypothetical protein
MKRMNRPKRYLNNDESGMATLEAVSVLIVFVVLLAYSLGSFGAIHTGILNSIGARAYAFETFRHRTNLTYLRSNIGGAVLNYGRTGNRVHTIGSEIQHESGFHPSERRIAMGLPAEPKGRTETVHNEAIYNLKDRNDAVETDPLWIKSQYGMCLNVACGD